jgi:archaeal flagellin FlaB
MKANHRARELLLDKRAQVGIGAMIVFIASVLVAAIAAAVLLDVSGRLQERSSRTGMEATQQVSSNLGVKSIAGERTNTGSGDPLEAVLIRVQLSPGAEQLDLMQLIIEISDGSTHRHLNYTSGEAGAGTFNATTIRDVDGSFSPTTPVMSSGDLTEIRINTEANDININPRERVHIDLIPEVGVHVSLDLRVPPSFGDAKVVRLR